jgi:exopolysaccharide biosynthesis polyprenyl glycosylphosphotransferase
MMLGAITTLLWLGSAHWNIWPMGPRITMLMYIGCLVVSYAVLTERMKIYRAHRTEHLLMELWALLQVTFCATGISCLFVEVISDGLSGKVYGLTALAGFAGLLGTRLIVRVFLHSLRKRKWDHRTWLMIGCNARSAQIAEAVLACPHFGINIAAVVDLPSAPGRDPLGHEQLFARMPLAEIPQTELKDIQEIRKLIIRHAVNEVIVCLPIRSFYSETEQILHICGKAGISVRLPFQPFNCPNYNTDISEFETIPLLTFYSGPSSPANLTVKRLIDIMGAAVLLLLLLPILVLIMMAIKLTSRGPIFFWQRRMGLHGRSFTIIKFRTMVVNAPQQREELSKYSDTDGFAFKIKGDPRVTPVGRFLRKYYLDELPQLWNVLIGEMSLVGPRPLPLEEANSKEWWQYRRLSMLPGLTCLWQVNGAHKLSFKRWMELDLEYIDRWSVMLDIRLILATIGTIFRGSGW